jgi:hypothetical protein
VRPLPLVLLRGPHCSVWSGAGQCRVSASWHAGAALARFSHAAAAGCRRIQRLMQACGSRAVHVFCGRRASAF